MNPDHALTQGHVDRAGQTLEHPENGAHHEKVIIDKYDRFRKTKKNQNKELELQLEESSLAGTESANQRQVNKRAIKWVNNN